MGITKNMKADKRAWTFLVLSALLIIVSDIVSGVGMSIVLGLLETDYQTVFQMRMYVGVALTLLPISLMYFSTRIEIPIIKRKMTEFRCSMLKSKLQKSYNEFYSLSRDEHLSHLTSDISTFEKQYFPALKASISKIGMVSVLLVILVILDWQLFLILVILFILILFISYFFKKRMTELNRKISKANAEYSKKISNILSGSSIITSNNVENIFMKHARIVIRDQEKIKSEFAFVSGLQDSLVTRLGTISMVLTMLYISYRISTSSISFEYAVLLVFFINMISQNIAGYFPEYSKYKAADKMLSEKLGSIQHMVEQPGNVFKDNVLNRSITMTQVSYKKGEKQIIKDVSMKFEAGKKYIILGESGSGKTTILNILTKRYNDFEGIVEIDGVDINDISYLEYSRDTAVISQDVFLLEDTILNNITLFKTYSEKEIEDAIEKSGLLKFINNRKDGLETKISDNGKDLSGGERQRIAIARAIIKKPKILFADEITSNLDADIATNIEKALIGLNATVVSVSHNTYLSIQEDYDGILRLTEINTIIM